MTPALRILTATVTALAMAGCTYENGTANQPGTGAVIGGISGAVIGNAIGDDARSTIIGGAIGAVVGGAIGTQMENQERELRQSLAGSGADVVNNGSDLRVILPEAVTFAFGSAVVNDSFRDSLARVSASLRRHPNSSVRVVGHTDNVGSATYNDQLSRERALAVARILISNGTGAERITYMGRGFREPITSNATAAGRALNRRVEIIITPLN